MEAPDGAVLDAQTARFGVREIRWKQVEGAPADFINPSQLVINGRDVRLWAATSFRPTCSLAAAIAAPCVCWNWRRRRG